MVTDGFTPTSGVSSWGGGPPVYDAATKKWHLFVSEIAGHCGMCELQHKCQLLGDFLLKMQR